jgi:hypothetical protein
MSDDKGDNVGGNRDGISDDQDILNKGQSLNLNPGPAGSKVKNDI